MKIPAPVQQVRDILGSEITAEKLQLVDKALLNKLANNMRNTMQESPKKAYKACKNDAERREWLAFYCMDPVGAINEGFNGQVNYDEQVDDKGEQWLTESQLAGPNYLNDKDHASICIKAKYFDEQPHEAKALADEGIKQYLFSWTIFRRKTGQRKEAGVSSKRELSADEYKQVQEQMDKQGVEPAPKKLKGGGGPKVISQEEKDNKAAVTARSAAQRKLKQKTDKAVQDMDDYDKKANDLVSNGMPQEVAEFYQSKIAECRDGALKASLVMYADNIVKNEKMETAQAKLIASQFETQLKELDAELVEFNKKYGKKMIALAA